MISKVIYEGNSVDQEEIIKAYINDNDQPQHIYINRLQEKEVSWAGWQRVV